MFSAHLQHGRIIKYVLEKKSTRPTLYSKQRTRPETMWRKAQSLFVRPLRAAPRGGSLLAARSIRINQRLAPHGRRQRTQIQERAYRLSRRGLYVKYATLSRRYAEGRHYPASYGHCLVPNKLHRPDAEDSDPALRHRPDRCFEVCCRGFRERRSDTVFRTRK